MIINRELESGGVRLSLQPVVNLSISETSSGFPGDSDGKESACNKGNLGSIPGSGRSPGEGNNNPLQYSCLGEFHGQRSLAGYSPWSHKESDRTEQATLSFFKSRSTSHYIPLDMTQQQVHSSQYL